MFFLGFVVGTLFVTCVGYVCYLLLKRILTRVNKEYREINGIDECKKEMCKEKEVDNFKEAFYD